MNTPTTPYRLTERFVGVRIGEHFVYAGTLFRKRSTQTADIIWPAGPTKPSRFRRHTRVAVEGTPEADRNS